MRTRELRRKERAERELREARAAVEAKGAEARARQAAAAAAEEDIKRLEQALRESQARRPGGGLLHEGCQGWQADRAVLSRVKHSVCMWSQCQGERLLTSCPALCRQRTTARPRRPMQQASAASSCSASWPSRYLTCQMYMFGTCHNMLHVQTISCSV